MSEYKLLAVRERAGSTHDSMPQNVLLTDFLLERVAHLSCSHVSSPFLTDEGHLAGKQTLVVYHLLTLVIMPKLLQDVKPWN